MGYEFKALRPGEVERVCEECGKPFDPASRTQRKCPECGRKPAPAHARAVGGGRVLRETERKVDRNTHGLNEALFRELERLEDCETADEWEAEGARADKVCELASNIIANGRLMLSAAQMSMGCAEAVEVPKMLLGRGDGR